MAGGGRNEPGDVLPVGTVTFLLTDIEGSTRQWETAPAAMAAAVARHYEIFAGVVAAYRGVRPVEQGEGDSVVAVFAHASDGVTAALAAQVAFAAEAWPEGVVLRVRMALHTGEAELRDEGNYMGQTVIRCARLRAIAHGGQVLVSSPTAEVAADRLPPGASLVDRGRHRLKDLGRPEHVFELAHPDLEPVAAPLRSLDALPNNLPVQLSTFVGRETELAELRGLLAANRLVTLNGVGGAGKTRTALQLAAEVVDRFPGGVWLVELAPITDPDRVAATIAAATGERDLAGDLIEVLVGRLGTEPMLVVLDNCEHLLDPISVLADLLLRRCPKLVIVATSREALGVPGEVAWRMPSMSLPVQSGALDAPACDSVRLFVDRAVRSRPSFCLDHTNTTAVAQICRRLDGIPLAIELAAARVGALSVDQIAQGLDDRFRLLTGGSRTVLARQQTLQASVDWGYELLSERERVVFRRLAVFAGGFTIDAAEAVVVTDGIDARDLLGVIAALAEKSMVVTDEMTGRHSLLETLRQYGLTRLIEHGEIKPLRDAHLAWAASLPVPDPRQSGGFALLDKLGVDIDNIRAAFDWALTCRDGASACRLAVSIGRWEGFRGNPDDGISVVEAALSLDAADPKVRLEATVEQIRLQFEAGLPPLQRDVLIDRAIAEARELGDVGVVIDVLLVSGLSRAPYPASAEHLLRDALSAADQAHDPHRAGLAASLLAVVSSSLAPLQKVERLTHRVPQDDGSVSAVNLMAGLRNAHLRAGNFDTARRINTEVRQTHLLRLNPRVALQAAATEVRIDRAQGRDSDALPVLEQHLAEAHRRRFKGGAFRDGAEPGASLLARGDEDKAVTTLTAWRESIRPNVPQPEAALYLCRALLAAGQVVSARVELETAATDISGQGPGYDSYIAHARGLVCTAEGDVSSAEAFHLEALASQHALGWSPDVVLALEALAGIVGAVGQPDACARLAGAAQASRDRMGFVLRWPNEAGLLEAGLAQARETLGDEAFAAAWSQGTVLNEAEAVAYACGGRSEPK